MVATRAAVDCCGPGHVVTPLSPTGTEEGQGWGGGERVALHGQGPEDFLLPSRCSSSCSEKSPAVGGPSEPRPQERVLRHTAEQIGDVAPVVPALGVLEPQMVLQLVAVLKHVDSVVPEQIIARSRCHPALSARPLPPRRWWNNWWKCLPTWWS